jgi:hypothetical protein
MLCDRRVPQHFVGPREMIFVIENSKSRATTRTRIVQRNFNDSRAADVGALGSPVKCLTSRQNSDQRRTHQPDTFGAKVASVCPKVSIELRDAIVCARRDSLLSVLTSKIRRATNTGEIRHSTTLLNSSDSAPLLSGTRHASVKSVDVP